MYIYGLCTLFFSRERFCFLMLHFAAFVENKEHFTKLLLYATK